MKEKLKSLTVSFPYLLATVVFITSLIISNIAASKQIQLGPIILTSGALLFPITYIVNDALAEVYGMTKAKLAIWLGFAMNIFMALYFMLAIQLPHPDYWQHQTSFATILGNTPRVLIASLTAYQIGSLANAKILVTMRDRSKNGEGLFWRCMTSTFVGEALDSVLFVTIAFIGVMPTAALVTMIVTQTVVKSSIEAVLYPLTRTFIGKLRAFESELN